VVFHGPEDREELIGASGHPVYLPERLIESQPDVPCELIRAHPCAAFVHLGPRGLDANHIPLLIDAPGECVKWIECAERDRA
jgi:hypothetical protein